LGIDLLDGECGRGVLGVEVTGSSMFEVEVGDIAVWNVAVSEDMLDRLLLCQILGIGDRFSGFWEDMFGIYILQIEANRVCGVGGASRDRNVMVDNRMSSVLSISNLSLT